MNFLVCTVLFLVRKIIPKNQHNTFMVEGSKFFSLITYFDHCDSEKIVGQTCCNVILCQKPILMCAKIEI